MTSYFTSYQLLDRRGFSGLTTNTESLLFSYKL